VAKYTSGEDRTDDLCLKQVNILANDHVGNTMLFNGFHHSQGQDLLKHNSMLGKSVSDVHSEFQNEERNSNYSLKGQRCDSATYFCASTISNTATTLGYVAPHSNFSVDNGSGSGCLEGDGNCKMVEIPVSVAERSLKKQYDGGQMCAQDRMKTTSKVKGQADGHSLARTRLTPIYSRSCSDLLPDYSSMSYNV
jgi:hypothetical protein